MTITSDYATAVCDMCGLSEEEDAEYLRDWLEDEGWLFTDDGDYCSSCVSTLAEEALKARKASVTRDTTN